MSDSSNTISGKAGLRYGFWGTEGAIPIVRSDQTERTIDRAGPLDRRIPRHRDDPVAVAVLRDIGETGERVVETLQLQLLGDHHVVDPAAGLFRHVGILVERSVPARMAREWIGIIGYIGLDEHLPRTRRQHVGGVARRVTHRFHREQAWRDLLAPFIG